MDNQFWQMMLDEDREALILLESRDDISFEMLGNYFKSNPVGNPDEIVMKGIRGHYVPSELVWPHSIVCAIKKGKVSAALLIWLDNMIYICDKEKQKVKSIELDYPVLEKKRSILHIIGNLLFILLAFFICVFALKREK